MKQLTTQMSSPRSELVNYAIEKEESLPTSKVIPMAACGIDVFYFEAGIDMLELPGTVGVIMLTFKSWLQ